MTRAGLMRRILRRLAFELRRVALRLEYISSDVIHPAGNEWRPPALPDWVKDEMALAARIEPMLLPIAGNLDRFAFYATPTLPGPGASYGSINRALGARRFTHFVVVPWLKRGGADLGALHHIELLARTPGTSVLVLSTEDTESPWAGRVPQNVAFLNFGEKVRGLDLDGQVSVLARLVVQRSPDVVHVINSRVAWEAIARYGRALAGRTRLFASLFCDDYTPDGIPVGYARSYLRDCVSHLQAVLTDNAIYPRIWAHEIGVTEERFEVVYFPTRIPPIPRFVADSCARRIIWAGRLDRQKRPDLLAAIAEQLPDVQFDAYGVRVLESSTNQAVFPSNVRLMGGYDGFDSLPHGNYAAYLNTSQWDGLPNVLLEATASGLPIVSTEVGGIADFLDESRAYLVKPSDPPESFAAAIRGLLGNPADAEERWGRAFERLRERHTVDAMEQRMRTLSNYMVAGTGCQQRARSTLDIAASAAAHQERLS